MNKHDEAILQELLHLMQGTDMSMLKTLKDHKDFIETLTASATSLLKITKAQGQSIDHLNHRLSMLELLLGVPES